MPAGELRREAHVLSALAYRERILVRRHNDVHRVRRDRVDLDGLELRRRERLRDVLADVLVPAHDVDLLARELVDDRPHAAAALPDARADWVDVLVGGPHRELRAEARVAAHAHDLDDSVRDLAHLEAEERLDELAAGAGEDHARTVRLGVYAQDDGADGIADLVVLRRDALLRREDHLDLAHCHVGVAVGNRRNRAGDDVAHAVLVFGEGVGALGVADLLHDHLARGLRRDAPEPGGWHLDLDRVAFLHGIAVVGACRAGDGDEAGAGILVGRDERVEDVEREVLPVYDDAEVVGDVAVLPRGLADRLLDRLQHDFAADAALVLDVLDDCQQLTVHSHLFNLLYCQKSTITQRTDPLSLRN